MKNLHTLMKSDKDNSIDDKKLDNFLLSVAPSLKVLDGGAVKALLVDQAVSVDVKVMLTQARAALQESVNVESQEGNKGSASKVKSKTKSPAIISKVKRQSSKSFQPLDQENFSSTVDDDGTISDAKSNKVDQGGSSSHSAPSSFSNPSQSSISGDLFFPADPPVNAGQVSNGQNIKHGRSTMAAARKILKKYPGTVIGSPNPTTAGEDVGSAQQSENTPTESAPKTIVKFNSTTSDAPVALCIYVNNDGYARYAQLHNGITFSQR